MPIITIVIVVNSRQDKTRQDKTRRDEIYIDSLHIKLKDVEYIIQRDRKTVSQVH